MTDWVPVSEFRQRGPVVLRMRLGTVTLGHLELLDELGVDLFGEWSISDLILIAFVLAQDHKQSRKDIKRWWFPAALWLLGWINRKSTITDDCERVSEWVEFQLSGPRPMRDLSKPGGKCSAPMHINLIATLLQRFGMSLSEARDMPVKSAKQLIMAAAESTGDVELVSESYDRFIEQCNAAEEIERN
jgi:hypothetical protein